MHESARKPNTTQESRSLILKRKTLMDPPLSDHETQWNKIQFRGKFFCFGLFVRLRNVELHRGICPSGGTKHRVVACIQ